MTDNPYPSSDFMDGFDRGYRLGKRLPIGFFMAYIKDGFVVRCIDHHTLTPDDAIERKWSDLREPRVFQDFLDELTELIIGDIHAMSDAIFAQEFGITKPVSPNGHP